VTPAFNCGGGRTVELLKDQRRLAARSDTASSERRPRRRALLTSNVASAVRRWPARPSPAARRVDEIMMDSCAAGRRSDLLAPCRVRLLLLLSVPLQSSSEGPLIARRTKFFANSLPRVWSPPSQCLDLLGIKTGNRLLASSPGRSRPPKTRKPTTTTRFAIRPTRRGGAGTRPVRRAQPDGARRLTATAAAGPLETR